MATLPAILGGSAPVVPPDQPTVPQPTWGNVSITPIPIEDIEQAIVDWIQASTSLPANRIARKTENAPQVPYPYIIYSISVPTRVAPDEKRTRYSSSQLVGEEVVNTLRANREFVVSLQAFTLSSVGGRDPKGFYTARAYLEMVMSGLGMDTIVDAMYETARIVFISIENVADLSAALGPIGQGRASLDVRFRTVHSNTETNTFIETVQITKNISP